MAAAAVVRAAGMVIYRKVQQSSPVEFLLLQTSYGFHHWTPPKGHLDPGEDEMAAAVRETEEEAGLTGQHYVLDNSFKKTISYPVAGKVKHVTYFLAKLCDGSSVSLSDEHQNYTWVNLDGALRLSNFKEANEVFVDAESHIQSSFKEL